MKTTLLLLVAAMLAGCSFAGLDVTWDLRATYISEELIAKRQADIDKVREQKRMEDIQRAQLP